MQILGGETAHLSVQWVAGSYWLTTFYRLHAALLSMPVNVLAWNHFFSYLHLYPQTQKCQWDFCLFSVTHQPACWLWVGCDMVCQRPPLPFSGISSLVLTLLLCPPKSWACLPSSPRLAFFMKVPNKFLPSLQSLLALPHCNRVKHWVSDSILFKPVGPVAFKLTAPALSSTQIC